MITFTDKIINENYRNRVKEKWEMTQIGKMIFDDGYRAGEIEGQKQGEKQGRKLGMDQKLIELSCRQLEQGPRSGLTRHRVPRPATPGYSSPVLHYSFTT